jgi:hypothetical protein
MNDELAAAAGKHEELVETSKRDMGLPNNPILSTGAKQTWSMVKMIWWSALVRLTTFTPLTRRFRTT